MDSIDFDAIVRTFAAEWDEHARAMEESLLALEHRPSDVEALRTVFRGAHTLKGNASTLGFDHLAEFAHVVEDLLDELLADQSAIDSARVSLLLQSLDVLRELVSGVIDGRDELSTSHRAMMARLAESATDVQRGAARATAVIEDVAQPTTTARRDRSLRVDIDKLDRLMDLAGEIAVSRARVARMIDDEDCGPRVLAEAHGEAEHLQRDLQELVIQMRMVRVGPTFRRFVRLVRDLAVKHGKDVRLETEGDDVEVDTAIIEQIKDPLLHMVRNALDHGIETPAMRRAAGKQPQGRIMLRAMHRTGSIVIQIADDGMGLDRERIIERAGEIGVDDAASLSDRELWTLIFEPGFSTAREVSELSGRGVGMDVVKRNIEAIRGTVNVESTLGVGTTITLRLPLTLSIVSGFAVTVGNETYLIPLEAVGECLQLPVDQQASDAPTGIITLRDRPLPYLRLRDHFAEPGQRPSRESVIVVTDGIAEVGLVVDRLLGESQTMIKPLGRMLHGLPDVAGTTMLADGRVALMLDVSSLLRNARYSGAALSAFTESSCIA
jgi:two-component system chemotaxis sensor kinase CheA